MATDRAQYGNQRHCGAPMAATHNDRSPPDPTDWLVTVKEIKRLKTRYFRFVDCKQGADYRGLFTEDATVLYPGILGPLPPIDEKFEVIVRGVADCLTLHQGFTPEISAQGACEASAIWADNLFWPDASGGRLHIRGLGHYHEAYRRIDAQRRIHSLVFELRALTKRQRRDGEYSVDPRELRWRSE